MGKNGTGGIVLFAALCGASVFSSARAEARTYTVNPTSSCTLPLAVLAANTGKKQGGCSAGSADSNTINLEAGTYTLTSSLVITKSLIIDGDGVGSSIVRSNLSSGTDFIIVQPGTTNTSVTLKELTIDKAATQTAPNVCGVYVYGTATQTASLSVQSARIAGHTWSGLYSHDANLSVADTTIENNSSPEAGGGIHVSASISLRGSFFVDRSVINNNTSVANGGGIYFSGQQSSQIRDTTISGNSGVHGGGVAYDSADPSNGYFAMVNCTVARNGASTTGGGIYTPPSSSSYDANVVSVGSIIANNVAHFIQDWDGHLHSFNASLIGDTLGMDRHNPDEPPPVGNLFDVDPMLDPVLRSWGGPTKVHRLLPGSPAIDAIPAGNTGSTTDQRNTMRPQFGGVDGEMYDMGAYEETRIETEITPVANKTSSVTHTIVSNAGYSNGQGTNLQSTANGQFVTYVTPGSISGGTYKLVVGFKKGANGGIWQLATSQTLTGTYTNRGSAQDGRAGSDTWTSVNFGNVSLPFGLAFFRFTVTGTSGSGRQMFPDYIELTRQ
ncbi:MAG: right-handed parallel beta-helix repeat-containing protein [Polyangiaceae bacterium]